MNRGTQQKKHISFESSVCKSKTLPTRYLLNGILRHLKFFQSLTERFTNGCHYISKPERREEPDKDEAFKSCWVTSFLWRRGVHAALRLPRFHPVSRVLSLWPFSCLHKFSNTLRCRVCSARSWLCSVLLTTECLYLYIQQLSTYSNSQQNWP